MQPDTIIPSPANPQSWNRFSYVQNTPINASDPTGHTMTQGDGGGSDKVDCEKYPQYCKDGKPKSTEDLLKMRNKRINGGSIYTSVSVIPDYVFRNAQLATKAQESYTGWTGSGEALYMFSTSLQDWVDGATGLASDFSNPPPNSYPITIRIDWHSNDSGMSLDNIEVANFSPTYVSLYQIEISNDPLGMNTVVIRGPKKGVGINGENPGIINMPYYVTLPVSSSDTQLTIQLHSEGGFPPAPYVTVVIPPGALPPGGCSFLIPTK